MRLIEFFKRLGKKGETLPQKVVRSSVWVLVSRISTSSLYFLKIIILANILSPYYFGLAGIGLLWIEIINIFTELGFNRSLIQKKDDIEKYINSAWTFLIYRGILLTIISIILAPYISILFRTPEANYLIIILSVSFIIDGFTNINIIRFEKDFEFKKRFVYAGLISFLDFFSTLIFAIILKNAWAIVVGYIIGKITQLFLSFILCKNIPKFTNKIKLVKDLLNYGKWIFLITIFAFIITQGDDIFLGWLLGAEALGLYQMAYKISNLTSTEVSQVLQKISFPTFCKLQDNFNELKIYFNNIQNFSYIIIFFLSGLILSFSKDFVDLFMGIIWLPMVPALRILALWSIFRVIGGSLSVVFNAIGKPKINAITLFFQTVIIILLIYPLTKFYKLEGTALTILISAICVSFIRIYLFVKLMDFGYFKFFKPIILEIIAAFLSSLIILLINIFLIPEISYLTFFFCIFIYILSFVLINIIYEKLFRFEFISLIKSFIKII